MSAYKFMWTMVMFDMPTETKKDKKKYRWFRGRLIKEGYIMMQYSIYIKSYHSYESAMHSKKKLKEFIKVNILKGSIRVMLFTDKQFSNMDIIVGTQKKSERRAPKQLVLF